MNLDEYIHYGKLDHSAEFQRLHKIAKEVTFIASFLSKRLFDQTLETTSIYRKKTTDSGIHEAYRAIDFRPLKKMEETYALIKIVNEIYIYDPKRPTIKVMHDNPYHGSAPHIHLQVSDSTVLISKSNKDSFLAQAQKDRDAFTPMKLG